MKVSKRKNQGVIPSSVTKLGKIYLQTLISRLMETTSSSEMKFCFRDSINHFGFEGFICDRSLFQPLSDKEVLFEWNQGDVGETSKFVQLFDEANLYNDIAQRLGSKSIGYLAAISLAAETYFGAPYAVCRAPLKNPRGDLTATVATLVIDSKEGTIDITPLPALNRQGTRYGLGRAPVPVI